MAGFAQGFYAIADVRAWPVQGPGSVLQRARVVLAAGPCCLQLRAKGLSDREILQLGHGLLTECQEAGVPFCVNDRVDLALMIGADGVHVGQDDLPLAAVRKVLQRAQGDLAVGVSTHNPQQAQAAAAEGADHIGFGPIFDTRSKARPDPTVGLAALAEVVKTVRIPVVAIGGITLQNAAQVKATGAHAVAVIRAVWDAADAGQAATELVRALAPDRTAG